MEGQTMRQGDYVAVVEFDPEAEAFHGRVVNLRDVVDFWGTSVRELQREFRRSVRTYEEVCREQGLEPSKPYSGTFSLRLGPDLHRRAAVKAALEGKGLAEWVRDTIASTTEDVED